MLSAPDIVWRDRRQAMRNIFLIATMVLLAVSFLAHSQSDQDARTFSITGQPEYAKVLELNGKSYVAVEDVARLTRGTLAFRANQIFLTPAGDPAHPPAKVSPAAKGFSKEFLQTGIEQMSAIREWRITIVNSIHNNFPVPEEWVSELQRRAHKNLALVAAARSTEDDRNAYQLLAAEFANMQMLSDRFLSKRKQLQYIHPSSIDNDPLDRQILACARSLASMAAENQFHDEPSCIELH
jgi:hypothetical protein